MESYLNQGSTIILGINDRLAFEAFVDGLSSNEARMILIVGTLLSAMAAVYIMREGHRRARAEAEVRELLARGPFERRTARTLTDPGDVLAEVARTRARGHAIDDEEGALGVCCLAVPVVTDPADGRWAASISLSGPVGEMAGADRERLLAALDHTARAMAADDELAAALATSPWC